MTTVGVSFEEESELSEEEWIGLLSGDYSVYDEKVIIVSKLPKSKTLRIAKDDFREHFPGLSGMELAKGDDVEIVPRNDGGNRVGIPDWAVS